MNTIRKILMPLLIIPSAMIIYVFLYPDWQWENPGLEYLFLVIGVPIVIINFIAWFHPEIMKTLISVEDDWGQKRAAPVMLAVMISTFAALACVLVGLASTGPGRRSRPFVELPAAQSITATAFALSVNSPLDTTANVSVSRPADKPAIPLDATPQIPVSGRLPTNPSESSLAVAVTATEVASLLVTPTNTVEASPRCSSAPDDYLNAVWQTVEDADPENEIETAWTVQSRDAANLWFVAAKIYGPEIDTGVTLPGVWALFVYPEDNFDIYAVNEIAMEYSYAAWGEDSEPVITIQNDGAQLVYDCAVRGE